MLQQSERLRFVTQLLLSYFAKKDYGC